MNPFDYVNAINNKQNLLADNPDLESAYLPFLINRAFSYYPDTIFHANRMNMNSHLDNRLQWDFYYHALIKKRRYAKWHKPEDTEALEAVKWIFSYGNKEARYVLKILTQSDIKKIVKEYKHRGG